VVPTSHASTSLREQFLQMNAVYDASRVDITQLLSGVSVSREAASHPTDEPGLGETQRQGGEWHSMATPSPPKAGRWRSAATADGPELTLKQKRKARTEAIRPRRPAPTHTPTHAHALSHTHTHTHTHKTMMQQIPYHRFFMKKKMLENCVMIRCYVMIMFCVISCSRSRR
jgi:hypothetical protein